VKKDEKDTGKKKANKKGGKKIKMLAENFEFDDNGETKGQPFMEIENRLLAADGDNETNEFVQSFPAVKNFAQFEKPVV